MNGTKTVRQLGGGLLAALLLAAPAAAQPSQSDWLPLYGCWQPEDVSVDHLLCVRPAEGGAEMVTWTDGAIESSEIIRADGQEHTAEREGCNGWESAAFSDDGRRLYLRSAFACGGDVRRTSSGLISMTSMTSWIDVQAVTVAGRDAARVMRYRLATPEQMEALGIAPIAPDLSFAISTARTAAAAPVTVDDVIDASNRVSAQAVQGWLVERGEPLALSADNLVRMADAGVPESVIDIAVAVSYPEKFAVNRADDQPVRDDYRRADHVVYAAYPGYYDPFYYDPFLRYSRFGSLYSPWGYAGGWGWYPGYNPIVIIPPGDIQSSPRGRVVNGRGYTRGTRTTGNTVNYNDPQNHRRSTPGSSARPTTTSGSRAAGVSRGTTSSGSTSSSSTGRKAKPRGGSGTGSGSGTGG